jgi:hypothetical protein
MVLGHARDLASLCHDMLGPVPPACWTGTQLKLSIPQYLPVHACRRLGKGVYSPISNPAYQRHCQQGLPPQSSVLRLPHTTAALYAAMSPSLRLCRLPGGTTVTSAAGEWRLSLQIRAGCSSFCRGTCTGGHQQQRGRCRCNVLARSHTSGALYRSN